MIRFLSRIPFLRLNRMDRFTDLLKQSWSISWPMILIMSFEFFINLTDVYIAGKIGKEVQAAVGFVTQVYFIFVVIANALTVGTVSVISRGITDGRTGGIGDTLHTIVTATTCCGAVLSIVGMLLAPGLIRFLDVPDALKDYGVGLISIYAAALMFHYLLVNTNGILRASGRVKRSLFTMAIVCAVNVGFNFYFVFHTPLGFRGIALSTALSVVVGCLSNLLAIRRMISGTRRFSGEILKRVIGIGWPSGLVQVGWQMGSAALFIIIGRLPSDAVAVMAALTNGLRIEAAIYLPAFALNMANAVVVGNLLGEKREQDAFRSGILTALLGVGIVTVMTLLVVLNAGFLAGRISDNPVVAKETVRYIYISMISEPFMAWAVILGGGLNGAGDTRGVMRIVVLSMWMVRIPASYFLGIVAGFGPAAIWWSMNASILVHTVFLTRRYFRGKWMAG